MDEGYLNGTTGAGLARSMLTGTRGLRGFEDAVLSETASPTGAVSLGLQHRRFLFGSSLGTKVAKLFPLYCFLLKSFIASASSSPTNTVVCPLLAS